MFETGLNSKSDMTDFVKLLIDKEISFERRVQSKDAEGILDTAMLEYNGRLSAEQLKILRDGFDGEEVEIGKNYISISLPESLCTEADF